MSGETSTIGVGVSDVTMASPPVGADNSHTAATSVTVPSASASVVDHPQTTTDKKANTQSRHSRSRSRSTSSASSRSRSRSRSGSSRSRSRTRSRSPAAASRTTHSATATATTSKTNNSKRHDSRSRSRSSRSRSRSHSPAPNFDKRLPAKKELNPAASSSRSAARRSRSRTHSRSRSYTPSPPHRRPHSRHRSRSPHHPQKKLRRSPERFPDRFGPAPIDFRRPDRTRENRTRSRSRSRSRSRTPPRRRQHSKSPPPPPSSSKPSTTTTTTKPDTNTSATPTAKSSREKRRRSPSHSRSRSRSNSRSRSRSTSRSRSRSRSRSFTPPRHRSSRRYSRSRSRSPPRHRSSRHHSRSYSHSRSRSYSPRPRHSSRDRASKRARWDDASSRHQPDLYHHRANNAATGEEAYLRRVAASQQGGGGPFGGPFGSRDGGGRGQPFPSNEPLPQLGSIHQGTVVRLQPFGAFVSLPSFRKHGLVHISRLRTTRVERVEDVLKPGQSIWVKVTGLEDGKIGLSMKDVDQTTGQDLNLPPENSAANGGASGGRAGPADLPGLYSILPAKVVKLEKFGAFVELLPPSTASSSSSRRPVQGLIHISQLSSVRRVDNVEDVLTVGDEVQVKVIKIENGKIGLSLKEVDQSTGQDLDPTNSHVKSGTGGGASSSNDPPALYSIHRGKVVKLAEFGAFVAMDGYRKHGLVHIAQLAPYKVDSVDKAVSLEESVWVKVCKIEDGGNKIGLSMKYIDQASGVDRDPTHINLQADEARSHKSDKFDSSKSGPGKIELEAVHKVTCQRCGAFGHLATDCMAPTGHRYDAATDAQEAAQADQALQQARQDQMAATKVKNDSLARMQEALAIIQEAKEAKRLKKAKKAEKKAAKKEAKGSKKDKKTKKSKKKKKSKHSSSDNESASESDSSRSPSPKR